MDRPPEQPRGPGMLVAVLLVVCCALPFLLVSGLSLAVLGQYWPVLGAALAVAGVAGFIWYVKRGWPRRR